MAGGVSLCPGEYFPDSDSGFGSLLLVLAVSEHQQDQVFAFGYVQWFRSSVAAMVYNGRQGQLRCIAPALCGGMSLT